MAKSGKADEVTHFWPLLEPLPVDGVLVTANAIQTTRTNARFLRQVKNARYLVPVLGNQPGPYAALDALPRDDTPVAAATTDTAGGRIATRTLRVLAVPEGVDFPGAASVHQTFQPDDRHALGDGPDLAVAGVVTERQLEACGH